MVRPLLVLLGVIAVTNFSATQSPAFRLVEAGIPEMQAAMTSGRLTSRELVTQYLVRLAMYEDRLNAALYVNPAALEEADALDRERAQGRTRGPLHGIPVALKDNIHTTHLPTSGGALAFAGYVPPYEATLTRHLRDAGAIIIAKAGLTELANWVAGNPTAMPGNYNAVGGFAFNPYDPRPDPRDSSDGRPALGTGGSSSGIGTAANLWAASVGTDTGGSVISPSNATMLVGIRPTIGRISRHGVIPITLDHDTAGPMTRSVTDAAIMMGALEGAQPDPSDPATTTCTPPPGRDYAASLGPDALQGRENRHPAGLLLRRHHARRRRPHARWAQSGSSQSDGRCHCRAAPAGCRHRRSCERAEPRDHRGRGQLRRLGFLCGRRTRQGEG